MSDTQMALSGNVRASISVSAAKDFDLATGTVALGRNWAMAVDSSDESAPNDLIWQQEFTLSASESVTVDLAGTDEGDPKDYWGADAVFATVRAVLVRNTTAGAAAGESVVVLGGGSDGAGTNAFEWFFGDDADTVAVAPGGFLAAIAGDDGWNVASGASILRLENADSSNAASCQVIVIGESELSAATTTTTTPGA